MNIKQNKYILNTDITKWKQFEKKKSLIQKKKKKRKRGSHLNKILMNELVEQIILWNTVLYRGQRRLGGGYHNIGMGLIHSIFF